MDEKSLVKLCLQGEERACKTLFDLYSRQMFALCIRYSTNRQDAEDNLQDGFIKVFQNLESWRSEGALGAWIRRIMVNTCISRQKSAYNMHVLNSGTELPEISLSPEIMSNLTVSEIDKIIEQMPKGYKTIFRLSIIEGYSYEEISQLLEITESTCRSQVFKAKNYLAKRIELLYPKLNVFL